MALTTKEIVKEELKLTGTSSDVMIDRFIDVVSAWIARHCKRADPSSGVSLLERQVGRVEYPRGQDNQLALRCYPIESISEIKRASDRDYDAANALVEGEDFVLDDRRADAAVHLSGIFLSGPRMVRVTYTGGYYAGAAGGAPQGSILLPEDLRGAATRMAVHLFKHRDKFGERQITVGDMSVSQVKDGVLQIARELLQGYVSYQ